jgi:hypothetical protein
LGTYREDDGNKGKAKKSSAAFFPERKKLGPS